MISRTILRVELLSLEVCCKTKELTKTMQGAYWKEGSPTQQLKCQEREIIERATRLVQYIEDGGSCPEISNEAESAARLSDSAQANVFLPTTPNCQNSSQLDESSLLEQPSCMNTFSDSGIDVTEETKEDQLLRAEEMMNGVSLPTNVAGKSLESVQDLRGTLGNLKRKTDRAVMHFLKRSRNVLHEEIGGQNHKDHDEKLLDLISDLLLHEKEADEKMTEIDVCPDKENPLSVFEKSLCYVLVDKALLNCLLLLDKAQMEGRLINCDLQNKTKLTGPNLLSVFSQAIEEKRELGETRENKEKKDEVIEKMRYQIRELTSEKLRLENENTSLEEKSRCLAMKSEELEMQNSVIDEERQLLKEKVSVLDESMAGLQSCTEHLRQQIETLEEQKEESRNEKNLLKDQLQSLKEEQKQQLERNSDEKSDDTPSQPTISCSASTQTSCGFTGEESRSHEKDNSELLNSATTPVHPNDLHKKSESSSSGKDDTKGSVDETLTSENEELRTKLQSLQAADKELRAEMAALTHAHSKRKEELQVAKEQSEILEQDLDERSTEIVLLQAHVLELKKTSNMAQGTIRKMESDIHLIKEGKDTTDGNNTILRRQKERLKKEVSTLLSQTTTNNGAEQSDNIEELCCNVSSLRKHFVSLKKSVEEKERTVGYLHERATMGDQRIQDMTELLGELAKRNEVLVNKLEMMGAVTVVRNDFDIPDGYQEAVDGILRSQSSMLEKGVLAMMKVTEEKESERKLLQEQRRRLEYNNEALETENILLKVQVSDLSQSVEELEEDVIYMKCGMNADSRHGRHPGTPKSSGSGGHHVTFGDLGVEKGEGGTLQALIQTAKRRCVHLERQVRTNTSLLKATEYRNETLERTREEMGKQNCCFRKRLSDFEETNKMLKIKVLELQDQLNEADEGKSLDEMERQSLGDRLKILEGQTKYLKEEKEHLKDQVDTLRKESKTSDEMQCHGLKTKYSVLEKEIDEVFSGKTDFKHEMECLKNQVKQQSTHSRILKCEIFEFLDDVRCLECELSCAVERVEVTYEKVTSIEISKIDTKLVSTWKDETSLCEQEGMAPIMTEILNLLKAVIQRLQRVSSKTDTPSNDSDLVDSGRHQHTLLRERLREETAKLRIEKEQIQREVFAMKAIIEHLLNQTDSSDSSSKAREEERSQKLRRQILIYIERNSKMESEILDFLRQQSELEEELERLKENILNLEVRKDVLLSLNNSNNCQKCCGKSCERVTRNFCFVKHEGHETQELLKVGLEHDNDDVFSCPSDEGVCHSPDREAGSCDSGYQSNRHDERHSMIIGDKVDAGHHIRHVTTRDPSGANHPGANHPGANHPGSLGSFYENKSREPKLSEISSTSTPESKPKSILKKRPPKEDKENSPRKVTEGRNESGCKVCNFSDLFKPFKRTIQDEEKLAEYTMDNRRRTHK